MAKLRSLAEMFKRPVALEDYWPHPKETNVKRLPKLLQIAAASLILLATSPDPAHALTEAETRAFIDELLGFYAPRPGMPGGLVIASEPTVSQHGAGFEVTLADVSIALYDGRIGLGDIGMHVQAADDGERLLLTFALPERATITDAGQAIGEILLGAPKFAGVWDPSIYAFALFELTVESVELRVEDMPLRTGRLYLTREAVQVADAQWDAFTAFQVDDIEVGPRSAAPLAQIDAVLARSRLSGIDLASYGAIVQALQFDPMSMWPQAGMSEETLKVVTDFYEHIAVGRIDSSFAVAGLRISGREFGTAADVSIGQVLFEFAWGDLTDGRGTLSSRIALSDAEWAGLELESIDQILPGAFDLDIEIARLPLAAMLRSISGMVQQIAEPPEEGVPMAEFALLGELKQLLSESGVVLRLRQARLAATAALVELQAEGRMDTAAVYGAVGELTLEVDGIDRAIAILRADPANTNATGAAAMLMLLQGFGEPVTGEPGANRLRYRFSDGGDGIVLLNGDDLSALIELLLQP